MDKEIEIPHGYKARIEGNKVILEPKESDDEKIREEMMIALTNCLDELIENHGWNYVYVNNKNIPINEVKKWLEKQQEQKPIKVYDNMDDLIADAMIDEINKSDMRDNEKHNRIYWINKHRQNPTEWSEDDEWKINELLKYLEEKGDYRSTWYSWLKSLLERFNLQPKQEWSEEDVHNLNRIVGILVESSNIQNWWKKERLISKEEMESLVKYLKSLPERFNLQPKQEWSEGEIKLLNSIINDYEKAAKSFCGYDGKIMLLKAIRDGEYDLSKQEWSDEDKKILYEIIRNVSAYDAYTGTTYQQPERHDKKINFLRTLHPSWKPSEEQMKILRKYVMGEWRHLTIGQDKILTSLYNDLQKIK